MAQGCAVSQRRSANPLRLAAASLRLTHAVQRSMVSALAHTCTLALRLRSGDGVDAIPPKHKTETVTAASSHMATKPSKECALLADQADAPDTVVATGEGHWRAGVNRQAQAAAREHQVAASQAAAAKRKADAMTAEERKAKDAERNKRNRADKKAALEAAAAAPMTRKQVNAVLREHDRPTIDRDEWDAFEDWRVQPGNEQEELELWSCLGVVEEWRDSDDYAEYEMELKYNDVDYDDDAYAACLGDASSPCREPSPDCPPPDGDPEDPYGGGSTDMYYNAPWDVEAREVMERRRRHQPGFVQLALSAQFAHVSVKLCVVKPAERYDDDAADVEAEQALEEHGRRAAIYGSADVPLGAVEPVHWLDHVRRPPIAEPPQPPPHRDDYGPLANNPRGDRAFRRERAKWFQERTGKPLAGSLAEQNEVFDALARSYRVDNTRSGRPGVAPAAASDH